MKDRRLWRILCLMTIFYQLGMSSRYGCLFQKKVCRREQHCLDDGLFGQCQGSTQEKLQFQISEPLLHRLQEALQQLMMQGLSWQDDITQYIIAKELSRVPQAGPRDTPLSQPSLLSNTPPSKPRRPDARSQAGAGSERYLDYVIDMPDSPRSSLHIQSPMLSPYTYQQYGYEDEEERSLNSLDGPGYLPPPSGLGGVRGYQSSRDQQLLQGLSRAKPSSHHRVAAGISNSPFHEELGFPLDYTENYISQEEETHVGHKQPLPNSKSKTGLDDADAAWLGIVAQLEKHGLDVKNLSPQQLKSLLHSDTTQDDPRYDPSLNSKGVAAAKMAELMEGAMKHTDRKLPGPRSSPAPTRGPQPAPEEPPASGPPQATLGAGVTLSGGSVLTEEVEMDKKNSIGQATGGDAPSQDRKSYITTNQSAVTLQIHQSSLNRSTEHVPDIAVAEKAFQDPETNLNILQSGVGTGRALLKAVIK
ncbi:hypothetical protein AGOR_G00058280 [Albula goreensis]|uniref:RESP18 domain-containing protein n=1 Tax=Albula goreensis TaxID=1534307 RepID=A0A8T3DPW5_9TELE|nr:hypothetical protein AGOR_G00058280 [Albula goreensis]